MVAKNTIKKGKFSTVGKNILKDGKPVSIDDFLSDESTELEKPRDGELKRIKLKDISPDERYQPRKRFDEAELLNLSTSIRKEGLLQPVIINQDEDGRYWLIAGERRFRACQKAGLKEVEAKVYYGKDPSFLAKIAVIENLQRENLNPIEEAMALKRLIDSFGYKQQNIANELGKNRTTINQILSINKLPDEIKEECLALDIPKRALVSISRIKNRKEQIDLFNKVKRGDISSEDARKKNVKRRKNSSPLVLTTIQKINTLCRTLSRLKKEKDRLNISEEERQKLSDALKSLNVHLKDL